MSRSVLAAFAFFAYVGSVGTTLSVESTNGAQSEAKNRVLLFFKENGLPLREVKHSSNVIEYFFLVGPEYKYAVGMNVLDTRGEADRFPSDPESVKVIAIPYHVKHDVVLWFWNLDTNGTPGYKEFFARVKKVLDKYPGPPVDILEGVLRVHPKFHYRYYIDGFGDGQACALFHADKRLKQIQPGSRIRVRGDLASKLFGGDPQDKTSALIRTWIIYMDVDQVQVLRGPARNAPSVNPPPLAPNSPIREK